PETAPPMLGEHVDVGEVGERHAVRERPREADLTAVVVEPDHPGCFAEESLYGFSRPSFRPVRLLRQVAVNRIDVDPRRVVVELETVRKRPLHGPSVARTRDR